MVAQGNALGKMIQKCVLVLKGQQQESPFVLPLQGKCPRDHVPRALPWATIVIALSARRNRCSSLLFRRRLFQCFQPCQIVSGIDMVGVDP